jgi:predicted extracellular nuclease
VSVSTSRTARRVTVAVAALGVIGPLTWAVPASAQATEPFISELHYDNAGTDTGEAVEVQAEPGTDLTGWSVELYNGNGGAPYATLAMSGVVGDAGVVVVSGPAAGIQNGSPDGLALIRADGTVAEFLSYEGIFTAVGGPADGLASTDIGVSEPTDSPVGQSLQKIEGTWRAPAPSSFGEINEDNDTEPGSCDTDPTHTIGAVQGSGVATPLAGQQVTVRGVVTSDLQTGGFSGYYLQDAGDGDTATSDGIFVFDPALLLDVAVGDIVQVTGTPVEFNGLTEIGSVTSAAPCETGPAAPEAAPLDLPATGATFEPLESMLVSPVDELSVTEVFNLNRFGEVVLSEGGILENPTEIAEPGPSADAIRASNAARRIVLDDGRTTNLSSAGIAPPYLAPDDPLRVGDTVAGLDDTVLSFAFNLWRLQPTAPAAEAAQFTPVNSRPTAPEDVGGDIHLAAFNVLNYFVHFGDSPFAPGDPDREARGAADEAALARQQAKIVSAISTLDADVVALQEIENSIWYGDGTPDVALATLVDALNVAAGAEVWAYVPSPTNLPPREQQDVITNAIIYQPAAVSRVGESVALNDETVWFNAREPIAQTFVSQGTTFSVVANHFKSKTADENATGDNADTGQGAYNGDRTRQAASLATFASSLAASSGSDDVVLMGDFNSYTLEDPIDVLDGAGYADVNAAFGSGERTFVFNGESGSLDHALASASLSEKVTGFDVWNINAVESFAYQYNGFPALFDEGPYRSSDHDALIFGLDVEPEVDPRLVCGGQVATIVGTDGSNALVGTPGADVIVGLGGTDVIAGHGGNDIVCGGDGVDVLSGGPGADTLFGGAGTDVVSGGPGDDSLFGGPGFDVLDGGPGNDTVVQEGPSS